MSTVLLSFKETSDGQVMFHGFLAPNDAAAEKMMQAHAAVCPEFGPAVQAGKTIEHTIEVDGIPDFDEEQIEAWVEDVFLLEEEDSDDGIHDAGGEG